MRHKPEYLLIAAMSLFALTSVIAAMFFEARPRGVVPMVMPTPVMLIEPPIDAHGWFEEVRRFCNPVEVQTGLERLPPPATPEASMYEAACWALAGRMDQARAVIDLLPPGQRYQAAGVVFEAGHPAADAGDEIAAGPLMELVVHYWPDHPMALYHAGAARFEGGSALQAKVYLERFLAAYPNPDGWRARAGEMLAELGTGRR